MRCKFWKSIKIRNVEYSPESGVSGGRQKINPHCLADDFQNCEKCHFDIGGKWGDVSAGVR